MIKGVNKSIIEVNDTENEYFEKAIFFVREQHSEESPKKLEAKAREYVNLLEKPPVFDYFDLEEDRRRKRRLFLILGGYFLLVAGFVLVLVL